MIPSEFIALVDKRVNENSIEIVKELLERIAVLDARVKALETDLKIMKEGVNL